MEEIKDMVKSLEEILLKSHDEYSELHAQLDSHRGKEIGETNLPEVNRLLKEIQEKFVDMHPILNFIAIRHQYAGNVINHYSEFIDVIKKAGAKEEPKEVING